jgi:hypothetical protein
VGFPIRKFEDQSLFAAPLDLSQRTTSFIASQHQGIHRTPLRRLIALIIDARSQRERYRRCGKDQISSRSIRRHRLNADFRAWSKPRSDKPPLHDV